MSFLYGLKLICDLCFYFTFANLVSILAGGGNLIFSLPFFAFAAFTGSIFLKGKWLKFVPMAVFIPLFYYAPKHWLCYFLLVPPCLYLIYSFYNPPEKLNGMDYSEVFNLYLKIIMAVVLFAFISLSEETERGVFSFSIVFILGAIILMRMARHEKDVLGEMRFKIMNSISVISIALLVFLISDERFLTGALGLIGWLYNVSVVPVLSFLLTVFIYLLWPILSMISPMEGESKLQDQNGDNFDRSNFLNTSQLDGTAQFPPFLTAFIYIGVISIGIYFIYRLFKIFRNTYFSDPGEKAPLEKRSVLQGEKGKNRNRLPKENNQIRHIYKKFLEFCFASGMNISISTTSEDIAKNSALFFKQEKNTDRLREIYIDARYGEKEFDKKSVKECKDIYNKIRGKA